MILIGVDVEIIQDNQIIRQSLHEDSKDFFKVSNEWHLLSGVD
jgi:hypothetical protein